MRILHYNILDGCQGQPDRLQRLGEWLTDEAFDVVGLNELNGWDRSPTLSEKGAAWGYPNSALFAMQGSRHFIGALSKHPIDVVETIEKGCHHGILVLQIQGIHYIITHLTPKDARTRVQEAALLANIVKSIQTPLLLMGDLNTLSPLDSEWHVSTNLPHILKGDPTLARKFLDDDLTINYRPMQALLDVGLVDLCANGTQLATVPTASNKDTMHAAHMRLDYILANQAFLDGRKPKADVLQDAPLPSLSDHFPVSCQW